MAGCVGVRVAIKSTVPVSRLMNGWHRLVATIAAISYLRYVIALESGFECLRRLTEQTGEWQSGFVDIYDMGGDHVPHWTARAFASTGAFKSLAAVMDSNYPERVRRGFIVRTPWIFEMFWKMFRGMVPKATAAKLGIYHARWTNPLREFVADDEFPAWLLEAGEVPTTTHRHTNIADTTTVAPAAATATPCAAREEPAAMTAEEAAAVADAAATAAGKSAAAGGGDGGSGGGGAAFAWRPTVALPGGSPLSSAEFRPDHDFPGGVVPKRAQVIHDVAKSKQCMQCATCGRPTAKARRKKCKSCGAKEFVPYKEPAAAAEAEAAAAAAAAPAQEEEKKKKGWLSGFWGSS